MGNVARNSDPGTMEPVLRKGRLPLNLGKLAESCWLLHQSNTGYDLDNIFPLLRRHKENIMVWSSFYGNKLGLLYMRWWQQEKRMIENLLGERDYIFQHDNAAIQQ